MSSIFLPSGARNWPFQRSTFWGSAAAEALEDDQFGVLGVVLVAGQFELSEAHLVGRCLFLPGGGGRRGQAIEDDWRALLVLAAIGGRSGEEGQAAQHSASRSGTRRIGIISLIQGGGRPPNGYIQQDDAGLGKGAGG